MTEGNTQDLITRALAVNAKLGADLAELISIVAALCKSLSTAVETPVKAPLDAPKTREEVFAAHRRAHRSGHPGKIESDPELEAFILARIDTLTFGQIVSDVRATFPPDRHCSHSGLGRWWKRRSAE